MRRLIVVLIGTACAAALVAAIMLVAARPTTASPTTPPAAIAILGRRTSVRPGRFVRAYAMCPRGYRVTGGGAYSGAVSEIISSPLPNLSGWFVDGTNTDRAGRTFQERADAVCVRAAPGAAASTSIAWAAGRYATRLQRDFMTSRSGGR